MGDDPGTDGRGATLPLQLTRFFGRDEEIAELVDVVARARLVTLTGAPGCGKTRLAVECGSRLAVQFPGGVWWVELAPVTAEMVVPTLATVLDIPEATGPVLEEALADALGSSDDMVIMLDNCEQVIRPVAGLVERLLATCPGLRVLATSRAPLGLHGEQVWNVPGLDLAAASELFVDRAMLTSGSRPGFDGADDEAVEEICAQLDGLPLAIELAAAWTRVLSPSQIASRLPAVLSHPGRPAQGRASRHATMAATVDWSYQLLPPDAQGLFERLSVFVGGFDLEAAEAVSPPSADGVLASLAMLVDHSLVVSEQSAGEPMRYRLLEPVRQCGEAMLTASGGHDAVRGRQAEHYLRLACQFDQYAYGGTDPAVMHLMAREENNLLAVLDWARAQPSDVGLRLSVAMAAFWTWRGRASEGRALLAARLAAGTQDPRLRANGLVWAGHLAWRQGDYAKARQDLAEALALTRDLGDCRGTAAALCTLALVLVAEGNADGAMEACNESLALSKAVDDDVVAVWARLHLAYAHYVAGDIPAGDEQARITLAATHPAAKQAAAAALFALQHGAFLAGDPVAQRAHLFDALAAMDDGGILERSDWLASAAAMAATEGRPHTALRALGGAMELARRRAIHHPDQLAAPVAALFSRVWEQTGESLAHRLFAQGEKMTWDELVTAVSAQGSDAESPLTARENEIARLVAEGHTNVDIARELFISPRTVESHLDHIRQKLGLGTRNHIIRWVLQEHPGPQPSTPATASAK